MIFPMRQPAAEESNSFSTDAVNGLPGSSTIPPVVDQEMSCGSNTTANKAVCTEDNFESREELLQKLSHLQWLYSLVKAELDAKIISTSPSRMLENDDKRTHYFTGLPSHSMFTKFCQNH